MHILLATHKVPEYYPAYLQSLQTLVLKSALQQGKSVHSFIAHRRFTFSSLTTIQNKLIYLYVKCGSLVDARKLFDHIKERDSVSWNTIIAAYGRHGCSREAVTLFHQMQRTGFQPDCYTFSSVLPVCAKMGALELGMDIHNSISARLILPDIVVATALVDMYAKCGSIDKSREVFDRMPRRNAFMWTAMITGYLQNGFVEKALQSFKQMQFEGIKPDTTTFVSILPACANLGSLDWGMEIHQSIIEGGVLSDIIVGNALVDMYAKCGDIDKARQLFVKMPKRDIVSWNALIAGYAQNGFIKNALETLDQIRFAGIEPDTRTFSSILPICAKMGALKQGMNIHQNIVEGGFLSDTIIENALVDMYAKCGRIDKACQVFDKIQKKDIVSWNTMIRGYSHNEFVEKALQTFKQMQLAGVKPNSSTLASILPVCAKLGDLELGMDIHRNIKDGGILSDIVVETALVDMYAKCGRTDKACELFDRMPHRNVVSWNAMIAGYTQNGYVEKALEIFKQMQLAGVKPDSTTFASILPACAKLGALEQGMDIHQSIMEGGFLSDIIAGNALIDMYGKCGNIYKARELFEKMPQKNTISWNAMIAGYAHNGFCKDALKIFESMKHSGAYPDTVSFSCVLCACRHTGLVDEGCTYFNDMHTRSITPTIDHYVCMVDLLARAGYLEDTLNFIIKMPIKPVVVVWMCFLSACKSHRNTGLGVFTALLILDLDSKNVAAYVLLSNIYAEEGRMAEVQMARKLMKYRGKGPWMQLD